MSTSKQLVNSSHFQRKLKRSVPSTSLLSKLQLSSLDRSWRSPDKLHGSFYKPCSEIPHHAWNALKTLRNHIIECIKKLEKSWLISVSLTNNTNNNTRYPKNTQTIILLMYHLIDMDVGGENWGQNFNFCNMGIKCCFQSFPTEIAALLYLVKLKQTQEMLLRSHWQKIKWIHGHLDSNSTHTRRSYQKTV